MQEAQNQPTENTANARPRTDDLLRAAEIVAKAIREAEEALRKKAEKTTTGPDDEVLIEGETTTGLEAHVLFPARELARLQLKYGTATSDILGDDRDDGFWEELARETGLATVSSHE